MKNFALFFGLFLAPAPALFSQDEGLIFEDTTYLEDVRSVRVFAKGRATDPAFARLGDSIFVQFDQLSTEQNDFFFQLVHCGRDWRPTPDVETTDFLDGFEEGQIRDFEFSERTRQPFVQYRFSIPHQDLKPTVSGNYLLKIYEGEGDDRLLAVTRRLVFYENSWSIHAESAQAQDVSKLRTHHEIDFKILSKNPRPANPMREVRAVVLQNGDWNTAIETPPFLEKSAAELSFDHSNKIVFPAGHEWRLCDLRNLDMRSERMAKIERQFSRFEVWMKPDDWYGNGPAFSLGDINGAFFLDNRTPNGSPMESEYCLVNFRLRSQTHHEGEMYLFGAFSEWKTKPEYRCFYDEAKREYVGQAFLRQGVYNYRWALHDPKTGKIDLETVEGSWWETENDYQILAYFKPFGERFERVVGYGVLNTRPD